MNQEQLDIAEQVLKELGLENLSEETKAELIETIRERVRQRTMLVLMENLPEDQLDDLEKAIADKEEGEVIMELAKRVPDLQTKVSEALAELYQELINDTRRACQQVKDADEAVGS